MENDDISIIDNVSADTLSAGDQIVIQDELFIIHSVNADMEDIDEILVTGENLSGGENSFSLFADDYFDVWTI